MPLAPRRRDPRDVAERAGRPGIEDEQGRHLAGFDVGAQAVERRGAFTGGGAGQAEQARAADVRRVHRRDDELGAGRLRLGAAGPGDVDGVRRGVAEQVLRDARRDVELFVRGVRREQEARARSARRSRLQRLGRGRDRGVPRRRRQPAGAAHHRLRQARVRLDPVVVEAADVAHPVAVDRLVEARRDAHELRALGPFGLGAEPHRRAAALLAERADRVDGAGVVPRPRLEAVVPRRDGADGADVHEIAGEQRVDAVLLEGGDLAAVAAVHDADLRVAVDVLHEADAARAQDAAVAVQHQRRTEVDVGLDAVAVERAPRELHAAVVAAEGVGEVLERALAALVADRAVERVVQQQELEHAGAGVLDLLGRRVHDHPVRRRDRARHLELRHLLDLHQADAAGPVHAQRGVIAVVRDLGARLDGGLEDRTALGDRHLAAVDRERDCVHKRLAGACCRRETHRIIYRPLVYRRLTAGDARSRTGFRRLDSARTRP